MLTTDSTSCRDPTSWIDRRLTMGTPADVVVMSTDPSARTAATTAALSRSAESYRAGSPGDADAAAEAVPDDDPAGRASPVADVDAAGAPPPHATTTARTATIAAPPPSLRRPPPIASPPSPDPERADGPAPGRPAPRRALYRGPADRPPGWWV